MNNFITWHTHSAAPVYINETTLTSQSQVLRLTLPWGGFVWQRPTAVVVTRDGRTQTLPITDVTRLALWAAVGLVILVHILVSVHKRQAKRRVA